MFLLGCVGTSLPVWGKRSQCSRSRDQIFSSSSFSHWDFSRFLCPLLLLELLPLRYKIFGQSFSTTSGGVSLPSWPLDLQFMLDTMLFLSLHTLTHTHTNAISWMARTRGELLTPSSCWWSDVYGGDRRSWAQDKKFLTSYAGFPQVQHTEDMIFTSWDDSLWVLNHQ